MGGGVSKTAGGGGAAAPEPKEVPTLTDDSKPAFKGGEILAKTGDVGDAIAEKLAEVPLGPINFDCDACLACVAEFSCLCHAMPLVGPLGNIMSAITESIREALLNKEAIGSMGLRVQEVAVVLAELLPAAEAADAISKSLVAILEHLRSLLVQAQEFVDAFGRRGFLSKMLHSTRDGHALERLDLDISGVVSDLAVQLGVAQLRMQQRTFDQVKRLTDLLQAGASDGAAVARLANCSDDVAQQELELCAEQLTAIREGQAKILSQGEEILEEQRKLREAANAKPSIHVVVEGGYEVKETDEFDQMLRDAGMPPGTVELELDALIMALEGMDQHLAHFAEKPKAHSPPVTVGIYFQGQDMTEQQKLAVQELMDLNGNLKVSRSA